MCPAHRRQVIAEIRAALQDGRPCRVVSTQLIEAGVDLDFPVVYRAMAGLDSIVQAAGRCNREGRLERGDVYLFRAPTSPPKGILTKALEASETMLRADPQRYPSEYRGDELRYGGQGVPAHR
jgi:CRISPR-associated endonuclease/helicase Cas3